MGSFIINQLISYAASAQRFRQTLALDMKTIIEGLEESLPDIQSMTQRLGAVLANAEKEGGINEDLDVFMLWESGFSFLDYMYKNASYVAPEAFVECTLFYDSLGRITEIRKFYNEAIRNSIVQRGDNRTASLLVAAATLSDIRNEHTYAIATGASALTALAKHHRFIGKGNKQYAYRLRNRLEDSRPRDKRKTDKTSSLRSAWPRA